MNFTVSSYRVLEDCCQCAVSKDSFFRDRTPFPLEAAALLFKHSAWRQHDWVAAVADEPNWAHLSSGIAVALSHPVLPPGPEQRF